MYVIYALVDPRDYTVHYVGQTTDVYQQFIKHINGESRAFRKSTWLFELQALNQMIIMETLEEVATYQMAAEREAYWRKHFEMLAEPLSHAGHRAILKKVKKDQMKAASRTFTAMEIEETSEGRGPDGEPLDAVSPPNLEEMIKRMHEMGMTHNQISKVVRLDGRKYGIYKQIYRKMGIAAEKAE